MMSTLKTPKSPIKNCDLPTRLEAALFDSLFHAAHVLRAPRLGVDEEELDVEEANLYQKLKESLASHPVLAQTVNSSVLYWWSLLWAFCEKTHSTRSVKLLIETNPDALLYGQGTGRYDRSFPLATIAGNRHQVLLPWIAQQFPWVFRHRGCRNEPPHLKLVRSYTAGNCNAELVREFYQAYPEGLSEPDKIRGEHTLTILQSDGWRKCEADLFIWMVQQAPEIALERNRSGMSLLYSACANLSSSFDPYAVGPQFVCTENMATVCRFLVTTFPSMVKMNFGGRGLPIHLLARRCNRPLVQDVAILLMREYPDCLSRTAGGHLPVLSEVPFLQQVAPLLDFEAAIVAEQEWLGLLGTNVWTATTEDEQVRHIDGLVKEASHVLASWAKLRAEALSLLLQNEVREKLRDICQSFEGPDVDNENVDSESEYYVDASGDY